MLNQEYFNKMRPVWDNTWIKMSEEVAGLIARINTTPPAAIADLTDYESDARKALSDLWMFTPERQADPETKEPANPSTQWILTGQLAMQLERAVINAWRFEKAS